MKESVLQKKIIIMASEIGHRLFRNNVGMGWVGESARFTKPMKVNVYPGDVLIRKALPLHAGLIEGSSDLVGWTKDGRFLAIETKVEGHKTSKDRMEKQKNFIDQVNKAGGKAFMTENLEDAINKIKIDISEELY